MVNDATEAAVLAGRKPTAAAFNAAYANVSPESAPTAGDKALPSSATLGFSANDIYGSSELNPSNLPQGLAAALKSGQNVTFSSAADNSKSNQQPDYIMDANGKIVANPKNPHPGANGSLNIQLEGASGNSTDAAKKIDAQLQIQAAKEMIAYYKYFNPNSPVPSEYQNIINSASSVIGDASSAAAATNPSSSSSDSSNPSSSDSANPSSSSTPTDTTAATSSPTSSSSGAGSDASAGGGSASGGGGGGAGGGGYSGDSGAGGGSSGGGGGGSSGGGSSDAGAAGAGSSSSAPITGTGDGMLTSNQVVFADELAKQTGMDTRVVAAWMLNEESGSAAQSRQSQNNNDWLNIGYTDSANLGTGNSVWNDPKAAADATANWMKGTWNDPGFGNASQGIQNILQTAGQSPDAQISAIQNSGWASGGETALPQLFQELAAKFPNGNINSGNAQEGTALQVGSGGGSVDAQKIETAGMSVGGAEGTVGNCLKGVEDSLQSIGINLPRLAEAKDMIPVLQQDPRFKEVPANQAQPGDVAVYGDPTAIAASGGAGHITILEPNGQEASDHIQANVQGFGVPTVFRYVGDQGSTATASNTVSGQSAHFELPQTTASTAHPAAAPHETTAAPHTESAKPAAKPAPKPEEPAVSHSVAGHRAS